ncbi:hypothetical protein [Pontibacter oryzae]|nr:hypothetical protein [Pontibacter oryzae]
MAGAGALLLGLPMFVFMLEVMGLPVQAFYSASIKVQALLWLAGGLVF